MDMMKDKIILGNLSLGIEFGSTRIKAILIDDEQNLVESGSFQWENQLVNGYWTYSQEEIIHGLQSCYEDLKWKVLRNYGVKLTKISHIGISAMMHGYLAFNKEGKLLVPFRTWRNSTTEKASKLLSEDFAVNIPERWSIAHLYQAILDDEDHLQELDYITTLAGYIHWLLTDKKVLGIGDASGMFPIDSQIKDYNLQLLQRFSNLISNKSYEWEIDKILPKILVAGQNAGMLTEKGAALLDLGGDLLPTSIFCPPEGDAGTGMVATNSVRQQTGNVSAGTSIFAMVVLANKLKRNYPEIDIVTTPNGSEVAMVHANNCTSDINAWVNLFYEFSNKTGGNTTIEEMYALLFNEALNADNECGKILSYGYYSGENIMKLGAGRPLLLRQANSQFTLGNLFKAHILSAFSVLAIGMELLTKNEKIQIDQLLGHGGIFTTPKVAQTLLASILDIPVSVNQNTNEGGAWGMAILADYLNHSTLSLEEYLDQIVFISQSIETIKADQKAVEKAANYLNKYRENFVVEQLAVKILE